MKKLMWTFLGLAVSTSLIADSCCEPAPCKTECCDADPCCVEVLAEIRGAYFLPTGSRFKDIYGGSGIYNLEVSVKTWCDLYTWLSVGYLRESGHSEGLNTSTTFQMVPLGLGLKYLFNCWCLRPYLGAGLGVTWMNTHNKSQFVIRNVSKWGVGGVFKSGIIWDITNCFFIDLFADYTYMKVHFSGTNPFPLVTRNNADISGFSFGGGIGWSF